MLETVLVNSNVYIGLLRRRLDPSRVLGEWIGEGDLAVCGIVRVEVERGLKIPAVRAKLARFFDVMINVPTSNRIWSQTADLAWSLDRRGQVLPPQDCLIATCAQSVGASILTEDAHFDSVPHARVLRPSVVLGCW